MFIYFITDVSADQEQNKYEYLLFHANVVLLDLTNNPEMHQRPSAGSGSSRSSNSSEELDPEVKSESIMSHQ